MIEGSPHGVHRGFPIGDRAEYGPPEGGEDHLSGVPCPAPPFGEDYVADFTSPFTAVDHMSDGLNCFAAALACATAVLSMHPAGNGEGMTG